MKCAFYEMELTAIPWLKHLFSSSTQKYKKIRDSLSPNVVLLEPEPVTSSTLETFYHTTADEIISLLRKLPPKSFPLDPVPTILIMESPSTFAPIISQIANLSIDQATVPSVLKTALIRPLLEE